MPRLIDSNIFQPKSELDVALNCTIVSQRTALQVVGSIRVVALGLNTVYIAFGDSSVTATAANLPIQPNATPEMFTPPPGATHMAAVSAGTAVLHVSFGVGE